MASGSKVPAWPTRRSLVIRRTRATTSNDVAGRITSTGSVDHVTLDRLREALAHFTGRIPQVPPMFSAIKQEGRKLYELARAGRTVERKPRWIEIFRLELLAWEPPSLVIEVECSKGTYIRSLAHDLGQELGCGAILQHLVRLRSGPFALEDSLSLDDLELAFSLDYWQKLIYPPDRILLHWPAVIVGHNKEAAIARGQPIHFTERFVGSERGKEKEHDQVVGGEATSGRQLCRAYTTDGRFIGVLRGSHEPGEWFPHKVLLAASQPLGEECVEGESPEFS